MTEFVHVLVWVGQDASRMACGVWRIEGATKPLLGVSSHLGNLVTCPTCRRANANWKGEVTSDGI